MSDVYGNAKVNIAATSAKDGSCGIFIDHGTSRASRQFLHAPDGDMYELEDDYVLPRCLRNTVLFSRAWVFQEWFLAKRSLYFTAEQIIFECSRDPMYCEAWPDGISHQRKVDFEVLMGDQGDIRALQKRDLDWCKAAWIYSQALLTNANDRLVVLSGVARHFQDRTPDQYVAGMWREDLERQLCWKTPEKIARNKLTFTGTLCIAPSWTWASASLPVSWKLLLVRYALNADDDMLLAHLVDVDLALAGEDPLGALKDDKLRLRYHALIKKFSSIRLFRPGQTDLRQRFEDPPDEESLDEVSQEEDQLFEPEQSLVRFGGGITCQIHVLRPTSDKA